MMAFVPFLSKSSEGGPGRTGKITYFVVFRNDLVDDELRCMISDFGQSESKSEVYRLSGSPLLRPHPW